MKWLVELDGERRPIESVWSDELSRIVGPLKATVEAALGKAADPNELDGLQIIIYAEIADGGAEWGFKFAGRASAVNYAVDLMGSAVPIVSALH